MEFFNKKEEVLEVILTQKGKELFSQGKFSPSYYSFHDNDITYDNGDNEEQNSIVPRIKETPTLKPITGLGQLRTDAKLLGVKIPIVKDNEFKLGCELGSKTYGDQYAPAWNINFISHPPFQYYGPNRDNIIDSKKYQLSFTSSVHLDKSYQELIPQFNIQTLYQVVDINNPKKNKYSAKFRKQNYSYDFLYMYFFGKIIVANYTKQEINNFSTVEYLTFEELKKLKNIKNSQQNNKKDLNFFDKSIEEMNKKLEELATGEMETQEQKTLNELPINNTEQIIEIKIGGIKRYFVLSNFENLFKVLYQNTLVNISNKMNELLPVQLQTVDDFVALMSNDFKTNYDFNYDEIRNIYDSFNKLEESIPSFVVKDIFGNSIQFYDSDKKELKISSPDLTVFQNQWLQKDPNLLISFQELNAYETDEFSEYELEYYIVYADNQTYNKLDQNQIKKYLNVYFDGISDLQNVINSKNIYGLKIEADETTC